MMGDAAEVTEEQHDSEVGEEQVMKTDAKTNIEGQDIIDCAPLPTSPIDSPLPTSPSDCDTDCAIDSPLPTTPACTSSISESDSEEKEHDKFMEACESMFCGQ